MFSSRACVEPARASASSISCGKRTGISTSSGLSELETSVQLESLKSLMEGQVYASHTRIRV